MLGHVEFEKRCMRIVAWNVWILREERCENVDLRYVERKKVYGSSCLGCVNFGKGSMRVVAWNVLSLRRKRCENEIC